jgi:probable HAF family extracellular repeat protein
METKHGRLILWMYVLSAMTISVARAQDIIFEHIGIPGVNLTTIDFLSADGSIVVGRNTNAISGLPQVFRFKNGVWEDISFGYGNTQARAISADGSIVIGTSMDELGATQAFYWKNGAITEISLGGFDGAANALSTDGSVIVGKSMNNVWETQAFRWENGVIQELSLGGMSGEATGVSANGSVVIGASMNELGMTQAFRWENNTMQELSLGGFSGEARALSADGSVVIGKSMNDLGYTQAFHWKDDIITELSLGGISGEATALSKDKSVVIGKSGNSLGQTHAFRWENGHIQQLSLGGTFGEAKAVSTDGSVVVGISEDESSYQQIFRWENGHTQKLSLGGLIGSQVAMSANGSVVVGNSTNSSGYLMSFRWTAEDGIKSLEQILIDAGVDLTGWSMNWAYEPTLVSADGRVIAGQASYNFMRQNYLMTMNGITTPEELIEATKPVAQQTKQIESAITAGISQSLMVARNAITGYFPRSHAYKLDHNRQVAPAYLNSYAPVTGNSYFGPANSKRRAFYALGNYGIGQNNDFANDNSSGSAGLLFEVANHTAIGGGLVGSVNNTDTRLGGHNRSEAWGAHILAAYEPPAGLRLYSAMTATSLKMDNRRHYMNGGGIDSSTGETDGMGYGLAVRGGYEMPLNKRMTIMPYTEWQISHSRVKGYTETGGAFPVTVGDQNNTMVTSRFGAEVSHDVTPKINVRGRSAWGHRYTDSEPTSVTTIGMIQMIPGSDGDRDWIEAGGTINYRISENTTISADLMARTSKTAEPAINATVGLVWRW